MKLRNVLIWISLFQTFSHLLFAKAFGETLPSFHLKTSSCSWLAAGWTVPGGAETRPEETEADWAGAGRREEECRPVLLTGGLHTSPAIHTTYSSTCPLSNYSSTHSVVDSAVKLLIIIPAISHVHVVSFPSPTLITNNRISLKQFLAVETAQ